MNKTKIIHFTTPHNRIRSIAYIAATMYEYYINHRYSVHPFATETITSSLRLRFLYALRVLTIGLPFLYNG